jgi:ubiquinone/menaquinone biosynthesis C-methylase UbiE
MKHTQHNNQLDQKFISKMAFLDSKQRETLIPPELLINQMPIKTHDTLLDVGAGTGFFTIPMAKNTTNKVYAMDPDGRMLRVIEEKAKENGLTNIELIQDYLEDLTLTNASIDFAMASLILHEVSSLSNALLKIHGVLKEGGHLLCLEYEKNPQIIEGPPFEIRIGSDDLEKMLTLHGFHIVKKVKINEAIYTILAEKKEI